jgi:hypothetical protein
MMLTMMLGVKLGDMFLRKWMNGFNF